METKPDNIIVNSCEYTPVYLIQSPSVTQAGSYILAPASQDAPKPVTNNLKNFYENSGNLDGTVLSPKPRILKRQTPGVVGNNLKLASFLLPKSEPVVVKKEYVPPVNNVVLKPVNPVINTVSTNVVTTVSTIPRMEMNRKIVRVGTIPVKTRTNHRILPKIKPKVDPPVAQPNPTKHTSVQLLKLGETYHSLNQLSDEQMKIVNKALKIFSDDPEKIPKEPAYDPVTNTKFIYKVVSPRDLTVVGKNRIEMKKKTEMKKQIKKENAEEEQSPPEPTVTRSGRTVKLPKQICPEDTPKPRKKSGNVVNCFQCSAEFSSLYRLQRHYETYPTHIPAKIHSNLFHCLLAIIKSGSDEDQANIFIQQLEQLIEKLKTLLPCLLKKIDGREGKLCTVNDDIGRLFGMNPGKYNLNMEALSCVKDKDGHCIHNPVPKSNQFNSDVSKPSQLWLSKHNEEIANNEAETEDCARINSVDKWPTVSKRNWKLKQQKSQKMNAKRMKLASESNEQHIELGMEDIVTFSKPKEDCAINVNNDILDSNEENTDSEQPTIDTPTSSEDQSNKPKHMQFHSTHFDIRSSPIKPSALVKKFQIDPKRLSNYEVQIMRPLALDKPSEPNDIVMHSDSDNLQLFRDNEIEKSSVINTDLNFGSSKDWAETTNDVQTHDTYLKTNILFESSLTPIKSSNAIEPSLIHMKEKAIEPSLIQTKSNLLEATMMIMDNKSSCLFEPSKSNSLMQPAILQTKCNSLSLEPMMHFEDKPNGLFESCTKSNSLIEPTFIPTKSNSLIEPSLMHLEDKSTSLFDQSPIRVKSESNLLEPTFLHTKDKSNGLFEALAHVKERSHSLFESTLPHKNKNVMIGPSLLHMKEKNGFFESMTHTKRDSLIEQLDHMKVKSDLIEPTLMHDHKSEHEQSDLNTNSQGHSVLNFFDSLGNECLAYPETEIRNNSVDFQDLFSFNSS